MRRLLRICIFTLCLLIVNCENSYCQNFDYKFINHVNPFIGTNSMGHTFPGATVPFGFVQLSPDTDTIPHNIDGKYQNLVYDYCAGYQYKDSTIVGFSHTHFSGTGHSDLGDILIMPYTGETKINPGTSTEPEKGYRSRYSHDTEKAHPGYYEVRLKDNNILAQLTATKRTGIHKYTYPNSKDQKFLLDLSHGIYNYDGKVLWSRINVINDTLITGYRITNGWSAENYIYFAISLSKPIKEYGYQDLQKPKYNGFRGRFNVHKNFPEIIGRKVVAFFELEDDNTNNLTIKVALSAVSTNGAIKNLMEEAIAYSFEELKSMAENSWEEALSIFEIEGNNDQIDMFYTSLYHTMINPSIYMDVDGSYRGVDHNIHKATNFTNYTVFSIWDTYRALHPLMNIINPSKNIDFINSFLAHYEQSVHNILPVWSHHGNENWCMIGYHAVSVLADAIVKGLNVDTNKCLEAMVKSSNLSYYDNTDIYIQKGYVPLENSYYSASLTLEYSYDDWAIYNAALKCGKINIANKYKSRALNYENTFDKSIGFARPLDKDGNFKEDFNTLSTHGQGFIEGNSWNYSFYVPHNVDHLIEIMGGDIIFISRLDSIFTMRLDEEHFAETEDITSSGIMGNYVHGNEPSQHIPYLYAWTSQPWKSQKQIRKIMNEMYKNNIDGLCGNDDCGQMSAWYIFSAMGFYPVCPGTDEFVIGAPYLPYIKLKLQNGNIFEIKAPNVSDTNCWIKSVKLNGEELKTAYITYDQIMNGGILEFEMNTKPNKKRTFNKTQKPYSLYR